MTSALHYLRATLKLVEQDVIAMYHHRHVWREVRPALVDTSIECSNTTFVTHYDNLYVSTQIATIRRLSGETKETASLVRLLTTLARSSASVTATAWVESARANDPNIGEHWLERVRRDFERRWAAPGTDHVDASRVLADRTAFAATASKAKEYADNAIAHRHHGVFDSDLSYAEIDQAIDAAGVLLRRYSEILNSAHLASLEPAVQGDWLCPLRRPLFDAEHPPPVEAMLDSAPPWPEPAA